MQDNVEIIQSIGVDLKESIDDLIHQMTIIKEDIETLKTYESKQQVE